MNPKKQNAAKAATKTRKPGKPAIDAKGEAPVPPAGEAPTEKPAKGRRSREPKEKEPAQELVVFAFRLTPEERELIHSAAGPAKASKFVRAIAVAAANHDRVLVDQILKGIKANES